MFDRLMGDGEAVSRLGFRGGGGGELGSSILRTLLDPEGNLGVVGLVIPTPVPAIEAWRGTGAAPMSSMLRTGDCAAAGLCARALGLPILLGRGAGVLPSSRAITSLRSSSRADSRDIVG